MKKLAVCALVLLVAASMVWAEEMPAKITVENTLSSTVLRKVENSYFYNSTTRQYEYRDVTSFGGMYENISLKLESDLLDITWFAGHSVYNTSGINSKGEIYNYVSTSSNYLYYAVYEFKPFSLVHFSKNYYTTAGAYLPATDSYVSNGILDTGNFNVDILAAENLVFTVSNDNATLYNKGYENYTNADGTKDSKISMNLRFGFEWTPAEAVTLSGTIDQLLNPKPYYTKNGTRVEYNPSCFGLFASVDTNSLIGQDLVVGGGYVFFLNDYSTMYHVVNNSLDYYYNTGKLLLLTAKYTYDALSVAAQGRYAVGEQAEYWKVGTNTYDHASSHIEAKASYQLNEQFAVGIFAESKHLNPDMLSEHRATTVRPGVTYTPTSQDTVTVEVSFYSEKYESEPLQKTAVKRFEIPVSWKHTF